MTAPAGVPFLSATARALAAAAGCCVALAACGGGGGAPTSSSAQASQRAALETYLHQIEPLRRAVNRLLARKLGVTLPADLQQAGRGEIAPSPNGS